MERKQAAEAADYRGSTASRENLADEEFGKLYYTDTVYINFDSNSRMAELFASDLDTERLIMGLELYSGRKIDPDHTLLIFDEVQEVPRALSSLKVLLRKCAGVPHCMRRLSAGHCPA